MDNLKIVIDHDKVTVQGVVILRPKAMTIDRWHHLWEILQDGQGYDEGYEAGRRGVE